MYRKLKFKSLDEMLDEAERLQDGGYDALGNWSLGAMCRHLSKTMEFSRLGFPMQSPWWIHGLVGPIARRWVTLTGVLPKMPTVSFLEPGEFGGDEEAVYKLRRECDRFESWEKPMAVSPLFGKMSKDTWRKVHLIHAQRHFGFLKPVVRKEDSST